MRELMPSFRKTLSRWYSTVRELMNSRAPISGFERPSRANSTTRASWTVSWPAVSTSRLRAVSQVAGSSRRARSANSSAPIAVNIWWAGAAGGCVGAAVLATQPLAVEQVSTRPRHANAGAAEALHRFAVEAVSSLAFAEQCTCVGLDAECPVSAADVGCLRKKLEGVGRL